MPLKKQAQRKEGQWTLAQLPAKSSSFITLKLGRSAYQRLLRKANPATLRWIKSNTLLWTQAQTITQQYLKEKTTEPANGKVALSHAKSPNNWNGGGQVLRLPPVTISAASHAEPADDGDEQNDANNKVGTTPFCFISSVWRMARSQLS